MKKQLLFFLFWVASSTCIFSQQINLGIRGGLNVSTVSDDIIYRFFNWYEYSQKPRIGFNLGIDAASQLSDKIALQAELFYSTEGAKASGQWTDSGEGKMKSIQKFDFLCLPVFVKYNFTPRVYIMAGPQVSYLLNSKLKYKDRVTGSVTTEDNLENMNRIGYGLVPALGYDVNKFSFSVRYFVGLNKINKNDELDMKSQVFSFVARYRVFDLNE